MIYTTLLKDMWRDLYNPKIEVITTMNKFFHDDYKQCINGVTMSRDEYIQHVIEQRKSMIIDTIDYKHILENKNELFAMYYPKGKNSNHLPVEAEVVAYFRFEHQKIVTIRGLVRLIKGDLADVDMLSTE